MGQTKLDQFIVYLDPGLARRARAAAQSHGGNVSAYLRSVVAQSLSPDTDTQERHMRLIQVLVLQNEQLLDHYDPTYTKNVKEKFKKHLSKGQSDAD